MQKSAIVEWNRSTKSEVDKKWIQNFKKTTGSARLQLISSFLKLKISANRQKTPNDTIVINTCILLSIYYC